MSTSTRRLPCRSLPLKRVHPTFMDALSISNKMNCCSTFYSNNTHTLSSVAIVEWSRKLKFEMVTECRGCSVSWRSGKHHPYCIGREWHGTRHPDAELQKACDGVGRHGIVATQKYKGALNVKLTSLWFLWMCPAIFVVFPGGTYDTCIAWCSMWGVYRYYFKLRDPFLFWRAKDNHRLFYFTNMEPQICHQMLINGNENKTIFPVNFSVPLTCILF